MLFPTSALSLLCVCVKDYITVSQLSQIFGMQRANPSSSSSTPSFHLASSESSFPRHSPACGPSSFLSAQVRSTELSHPLNIYDLCCSLTWLGKKKILPHVCLSCLFLSSIVHLFVLGWMLFDHLRASLSSAGMQCLPLILSAGTRTSWLLEILSHVLHRCLQSLFPLADTGR